MLGPRVAEDKRIIIMCKNIDIPSTHGWNTSNIVVYMDAKKGIIGKMQENTTLCDIFIFYHYYYIGAGKPE